ncbi:HNH endonuclease [Hahella sp. KA22]|nr:HNH endonuclease [Hahella chejuensis]AZZ89956.1 HNH endonuclease [Hahella sp. KA22]QAY53325.1 HNH endonuclease [Hahella sp. KA22]
MYPMVLKITPSGLPQCWLDVYAAVTEIVCDRALYTFGEICSTLHGGYNSQGVQSTIDVPQIIVGRKDPKELRSIPPLLNRYLFSRDSFRCMYCGEKFHHSLLSRDHIVPLSRGGRNVWTNVVTACKRCNGHKGARLLSECNMELLAVPYTPNRYEYLYLANRRILADQMEYLKKGFRNLVA